MLYKCIIFGPNMINVILFVPSQCDTPLTSLISSQCSALLCPPSLWQDSWKWSQPFRNWIFTAGGDLAKFLPLVAMAKTTTSGWDVWNQLDSTWISRARIFYWGKISLDLLLLPMNSKYILHHVGEQCCTPSPPYQSSPLLGDFSNGSPWITSKDHSLPP